MDKKLVDIVLCKSFVELTTDERHELLEWCSNEDEFDQMKNVFIEVELMKKQQTETVRPETKKSLDALFTEKNRRGGSIIWNSSIVTTMYPVEKPFHRRPLIQIAALLLLLLLSYPIFQKNKAIIERPELAKNESVSRVRKQNSVIAPVKEMEKQEFVNVSKLNKQIENNFTGSKKIFQGTETKYSAMNIVSSNSTIEHSNPVMVVSAAPSYGYSTASATVSPNMQSVSFGEVDAEVKISAFQPDGFYIEDDDINYSKPISDNSNVLDLLTVTF